MSTKQIADRTATIMQKLGFTDASVDKAEKDRVVVSVASKFPQIRRALSRQYGHAAHNIEIAGGRRATWHVDGKGTLVAKSSGKNKVKVTFSTMPFIHAH